MKLLLACGGTGGHIFPAFSVAEEIKKRHPAAQIVYVCGKKDIEHEIFKIVSRERVFSVDSAPYRGAGSLLDPSFLFRLASGFLYALNLLASEKPDVVVGFGGHFSFPVVLMAKMTGIPAIAHEQNVIPGRANRCLAGLVSGLALSFPETAVYLPKKTRYRITGNPIRSAIESVSRRQALDYFSFDAQRRTILVLGGSQGSESINAVFLEALGLLPEPLRGKIQVLHLCGKLDSAIVRERLRSLGIPGQAHSFFDRMDMAYGAADLAIGRAGATFLAELAASRVPGILVPYPFGDGHQAANAGAYVKTRPAVIVPQAQLRPELLAQLLTDELKTTSAQTRAQMNGPAAENSRTLLADYIESFVRKK